MERNIDLCVVTETWLHDESGVLMDDATPLSLGEGVGVVHRGRPVRRRGGGVGIFFRQTKMKVVDIRQGPLLRSVLPCVLSGTAPGRSSVLRLTTPPPWTKRHRSFF